MLNVRTIFMATLLLLLVACGGSSSHEEADQLGGDQVDGVDSSDGTQPIVSRLVVSSGQDGVLSLLWVDGPSGSLRHRSFLPGDGFSLESLALSPDGRFIYAAAGNGLLHTFALDATKGSVTEMPTLSLAGTAKSVVLDSSGGQLYVALGSAGVAHLAIDPVTGVATQSSGPYTGLDASRLVLHPSGSLLLALDRTNSKVVAYTRTLPGGTLSPAASSTIDSQATSIALDLRGKVAYVTYNESSDNVKVYDLNPSTGALTPRQTLTAGSNPAVILVNHDGTAAYVGNSGSNNVTRFTIASETGELTKKENVTGDEGPTSLALSPAGDYLYSGNVTGSGVSVFRVSPSDGSLTLVDTIYVAYPVNAVVSVPGSAHLKQTATHVLAPDKLGVQLYDVTDDQGTLSLKTTAGKPGSAVEAVLDPLYGVVYSVESTDNKIVSFPFDREPDTTTPYTALDGPADIPLLETLVVGPLSRYLYVLDTRNQSDLAGRILRYEIGPAGLGTLRGSTNTGSNPEALLLHPAGRWMYSLNSFADTISLFELSLSAGTLALKKTMTPGQAGQGVGRPLSLDFHPNGRYAYLTLSHDRELVRYHVAPTNGELETPSRTTTVGVSAVDDRPLSIAVDPQGHFAVVSFIGAEVVSYRIDPQDFTLSKVNSVLLDGLAPRSLAVDPQSRFVYVTVKGGTARLLVDADGKLSGPVQTELTGDDSTTSYRAVTIVDELK
ncbi:MAG: beta-propeller fold lactonase family protein [Myxococcales bacterium]|nr:beta-propeller fold lactonase family protein [Myxococcales bacterium]